MQGKELVKKAFSLQKVERIPWVPFVGVHGGKLIGISATDYLKSADNIVMGISKAIELYQPDGIPVAFDLQIEAEILGCNLIWADENPPAVVSHPLLSGTKLSDLKLPTIHDGRIPVVLEATRKLRAKYPDIALYGLITGPFTLALHLLGTDVFMKIYEDPEYVTQLFNFTKEICKTLSKFYIDAGCDVIALVDPMTSQIDTMTFESFVQPSAKEIFSFIREQGALSSFFVCGHAQQNIEIMCKCGPDNVSIDENIPLDFVKEIALKNKVSFGGNLKLTVVLLMGTSEDSQREALECIDLGGNVGFILSPGCDLPMATPVENLKAVSQLAHDPYQQDVVRALETKESTLELLNMKDYGQSDKVVVDIITLDSESCAPCQYMVEAVKRVAPYFEGIVEWREHAVKKMESVTFMASLMVKNIPTICIDGKIAFVSQIPPQKDLIATIQKRINEKLKLKIHSKQAEISILCREGDDYNELENKIKQAMQETGKNFKINIVNDEETIRSFDILATPAILLTEYKLKSQGENPSIDVIKEWFKSL